MKQTITTITSTLVLTLGTYAAPYADSVVSSSQGTNPGAQYDSTPMSNPSMVLGAPSASTTDFGFTSAVDPFSSPYLASQLFSVGTGGSLTVKFNAPILNNPANPYGRDFIIFGNTFLQAPGPNYDTSNGTLGGNNAGSTKVSVSADGISFFALNSSLAPVVDGLFPTDANGNFQTPVNPSLTPSSFNGLQLNGVRALYGGSGGGTSYDIGWAQDGNNQTVVLGAISYVRVDVLSGASEIDAFSAVSVPEPGSLAMVAIGMGLVAASKRKQA